MKKTCFAWLLALVACFSLMAVPAEAAEQPMTRGETCQLIVDTLELKYDVSSSEIRYDDVPETHPNHDAIIISVECGILVGYSDREFRPEDTITRGQAATFLYRANTGVEIVTEVPRFTDVDSWAYYYDGVCFCTQTGIMAGKTPTTFEPGSWVYRSEINTQPITDHIASLKPTADPITLDLSKGSIEISENEYGGSAYTQNDVTVRTTGSCLIQQSNPTTPTSNTVTVKSGEQKITIAGLNVETTKEHSSPIKVTKGAALALTLMGKSTFKAGKYAAGIEVPEGAELSIQGSGMVMATGGGDYGAGIGSGDGDNGGTITITDGAVTAIGGGRYGAGIGGGSRGSGGTVTITGGTVMATACGDGAGIGGGEGGNGGTVTITGGKVTATGGDYGGAGIGGGWAGNCGMVTISGGAVTATGGFGGDGSGVCAAGIGGGGDGGLGGTITISGGVVTATGGYHSIGGGSDCNHYGCDIITIDPSAKTDLPNGCQERIDGLDLVAKDAAALAGNTPLLITDANGYSGIKTYQWQTSPDNTQDSVWTDVPDQTTATLSIPVTEKNNNHYYRCKVTNGWGNEAYTTAVQAKILTITKHPADAIILPGDSAYLEAGASAANVTYEWQKSVDNGGTWIAVSDSNFPGLMVTGSPSENGNLYRCKVIATNGDSVLSDSAKITVNTDKPTYTTRFFLENPDGSYTAHKQEVVEAEAGTTVSALEKVFPHYTENTTKGIHSGVVAKDSTLILSRYYDRNSYTLTFDPQGGGDVPAITAKFGTAVALPEPSRHGYTFGGWFTDPACAQPGNFDTMPTANTTLYAKWDVVGGSRGEEYRINGISLMDSSYRPISGPIPTGSFYAEVSITNLCSRTRDVVILAAYDHNGRQLGLHYMSADPIVGQTLHLGVLLDNSKGEIGSLKAFTLPMLGGFTPLSNSVEYPNRA